MNEQVIITGNTAAGHKQNKVMNVKGGVIAMENYINDLPINEMNFTIPAKSNNEALARSIVAAFCIPTNPTVEELEDIKTAVSEAVTNCIVHAYDGKGGKIDIKLKLFTGRVEIYIKDYGMGISNIEEALTPFYTTKSSDERSGMGFTIMESFMDSLKVVSENGLEIKMVKNFTRV